MQFTSLSPGEQIMKQLRFGWDLLLTHRSPEEARLHFVNAMAQFPDSPFLVRELAAASVLSQLLPRGDGNLHRDQAGHWAHIIPPESTSTATSLDAWETFAALRFKMPKKFLSEEESELLAAGMLPHGCIPLASHDASWKSPRIREHRLRHEIELLAFLEKQGFIRPKLAMQGIDAYRRVLHSAPKVREGLMEPTTEQWHSLYPFYNRRLYVHPCPRQTGQTLNPPSEMRLVHSPSRKATSRAGGFLSPGGVLIIDNLLILEALNSLRDFAELSTIWYLEAPDYLGAGLATGFSPPLLAQVAEELRILLADVLCDLPLTSIRAFKFGVVTKDMELHSDEAAVNVHLWLTPETPSKSTRLTVFDSDLTEKDGENISIPQLQNRAVVFDSARIYQHSVSTPKDLSSHGISVTLLFGIKGVYCAQRRSARILLEEVPATPTTEIG